MNLKLDGLIALAKKNNPPREGDYQQDGLWHCGECHSKKEHILKYQGTERIVPCNCECRNDAWERAKAEWQTQQRAIRIEQLKNEGVADVRYLDFRFEKDDSQAPCISKMCHNFVTHFEEIRKNHGGLLFYGNVGTGKTFYACCIANALLEQGYPVVVTNFSSLLQQLQDFEKQKFVIPRLCKQKLVVIDDLGTERNTSYGKEQVFMVVDSLVRAGVTTIITSNLSPNDMRQTTDLDYSRIYDRILGGLCPEQVPITGKSRREQEGEEKKASIRQYLWGT